MDRDRNASAAPAHLAPAPDAGSSRQAKRDERSDAPQSAQGARREPPAPLALAFVALALVVMAAPLALTPLAPDAGSAEKRSRAELPQATADGGPNLDFPSQLGAWYTDHFALRSALVDLDATVRQRAFLTSATDSVVVGTDGWLYYAGELNDWRRANSMSDRAVQNAAHNLALVSEGLSAQGKRFAVAIAPNKSTLCPSHMPPWYVRGTGEGNAERLGAALAARGVPYVNLFDALAGTGDDLYLERDSHWNNGGALVAADALLGALGRTHGAWADARPGVDATHVGDLDAMLHPASAVGEPQPTWSDALDFAWSGGEGDVEAAELEATAQAPGSLLMFRDSFGNALVPYMAGSYGHSAFSKLVPYNMSASTLRGVDDVVIERAERHVSDFASSAPYLAAPERTPVNHGAPQEGRGHVSAAVNGPFLQVQGEFADDALPEGSLVYVEVLFSDGSASTYEAFLLSAEASGGADSESTQEAGDASAKISGDCGFCAFVSKEAMGGRTPTGLSVLSVRDGQAAAAIGTAIDVGGQL